MFRAVGQSSPAKRGLQKESLAVMTRVIQAFNHVVTPCVITEEKIKRWKKRKFYKREIRIFSFLCDSTEISEISQPENKNNNNKRNL